jgi:transcription elongation GreA/GreB family factor
MRPGRQRRQTKTRSVSPTTEIYQDLPIVNKSDLRAAILEELKAELARQTKAAELARDEAISEESQPENKWDTHSQEAAYLAEGQARLVLEVGQSIALFQNLALPAFNPGDQIALGAVVGLQNGRETSWYFVGPRAGGIEVVVGGRKVLVVTPQSPLGRQLVGKRAGDEVMPPGTVTQPRQQIAAVE